MSAIPKAITPNPHTNLLNLYTQIANKMGFQTKQKSSVNGAVKVNFKTVLTSADTKYYSAPIFCTWCQTASSKVVYGILP
jgi:hypothetical protein